MLAPRFGLILSVGCVLGGAPVCALAGDPSRTLSTYVLFALDDFRTKGLTAVDGNIGVNQGALAANGALDAPASQVVADTTRLDQASVCAQLFSNNVVKSADLCGPVAMPFASPIIADPRAACGFPAPFPTCDPSQPIKVLAGETRVLAPGAYGAVTVKGGAGAAGSLILSGGQYVFCSLRTSRETHVLANGPVQLSVVGKLAFGPRSENEPVSGSGLSASDFRIFGNGTNVKIARGSQVRAVLCAPGAAMTVTESSQLTGTFLARTIRTERILVDGEPSPSPNPTTTTTTTTTVTTAPGTTLTTTTHVGSTTTTTNRCPKPEPSPSPSASVSASNPSASRDPSPTTSPSASEPSDDDEYHHLGAYTSGGGQGDASPTASPSASVETPSVSHDDPSPSPSKPDPNGCPHVSEVSPTPSDAAPSTSASPSASASPSPSASASPSPSPHH